MGYFGSKATAGLCQPLIAMMPPHSTYIETHLGSGAIMRRKPPAQRNIGIDLDGAALAGFSCAWPVELVHGCCHRFLSGFPFDGSELVYSDPPYLRHTRKSARRYRHDYEDADHVALLELLKGLPCRVMVSGYPSALYDQRLAGWRSLSLQVMNRAGVDRVLAPLSALPAPRRQRLHVREIDALETPLAVLAGAVGVGPGVDLLHLDGDRCGAAIRMRLPRQSG